MRTVSHSLTDQVHGERGLLIECIFSVVLVAAIVALCHFVTWDVRYLQSHRNCETGGLEGCLDLEEIA